LDEKYNEKQNKTKKQQKIKKKNQTNSITKNINKKSEKQKYSLNFFPVDFKLEKMFSNSMHMCSMFCRHHET
jgi:hypothetical protein